MPDTYKTPRKVTQFQKKQYRTLYNAGFTYLDWTGAGQPLRTALKSSNQVAESLVFGNTHSINQAATNTEHYERKARAAALAFLDTDSTLHTNIFTAGASASLNLIRYHYFSAQRMARVASRGGKVHLLMSEDVHNSLNGLRTIPGVEVQLLPVHPVTLRLDESQFLASLKVLGPHDSGLVMLTAQSNVSGVRTDPSLLQSAKDAGWDTFFDIAAWIPTTQFSLRTHPYVDFVPISWYKVLGDPTGLGSLIVAKTAWSNLHKDYFSGGTVTFVANTSPQAYALHDDYSKFEDGTGHLRGWISLYHGLDVLMGSGLRPALGQHVVELTVYMLESLQSIHWESTGHPLLRIVGFPTAADVRNKRQGSTLSLVFYRPNGEKIPYEEAVKKLTSGNFAVRGGCMCNTVVLPADPGPQVDRWYAQSLALPMNQQSQAVSEAVYVSGMRNYKHYLNTYQGKDWVFDLKLRQWTLLEVPGSCLVDEGERPGVVRISIGMGTTIGDVRKLHRFLVSWVP